MEGRKTGQIVKRLVQTTVMAVGLTFSSAGQAMTTLGDLQKQQMAASPEAAEKALALLSRPQVQLEAVYQINGTTFAALRHENGTYFSGKVGDSFPGIGTIESIQERLVIFQLNDQCYEISPFA